MRHLLIYILCVLIFGCASEPNRASTYTRLEGVWEVDVKSTVLEHKMRYVPQMDNGFIDPKALETDSWEFSGNRCNRHWRGTVEEITPINIYEEGPTSVVILFPPKPWSNNQYSSQHPPLKELIELDPIGAYRSVTGLMGFEFTGENEIRIFRIRIDLKGKPLRQFTGIHLIRKID